MPHNYFSNFPIVSYANTRARAIASRVVLSDGVLASSSARTPLEVRPGVRPDVVASRYYSDPGATWLVLTSAGVIDPWWDWYLDDEALSDLAVQRHGSVEEAEQKVRHYELAWPARSDELITPAGWSALPEASRKYWEPVYGAAGSVVNYMLRREDWLVSTNLIIECEVTSANGDYEIGERMVFSSGGANIGGGHIAWSNSSIVHVQHVSGNTTTVGSVLTGVSSGATSELEESSVSLYVIPQAEQDYWAPVTEMEHLRSENEKKRLVMLLDKGFLDQARRELVERLRRVDDLRG